MNKKIKKLCEILARDLAKLHKGDTVSGLWPFIPNEAEHYVGSFFVKNLYNTIKKLKERNFSKKDIAMMFGSSSRIAQYFTLLHGAKTLELNERKELTEDLIDFLSCFREDAFCENRENRLINYQIDSERLKRDDEIIKLSTKFSGLMLLYLEILYPTMMRLGHEFHGIYKENNKKIFVKDFFNLDPFSLNMDESFPVKKIRIVDEVEGEIELDFFNHLFKSPKKKMSSYILIDGKEPDKENLKKLYFNTEKKIQEIISETNSFSRKDWFKVYARGIFYSLDNLKRNLGEKAKIPEGIFQKIEDENFELPIEKIKEFNKNHSEKEIEEITKNSFMKIFTEQNEK